MNSDEGAISRGTVLSIDPRKYVIKENSRTRLFTQQFLDDRVQN